MLEAWLVQRGIAILPRRSGTARWVDAEARGVCTVKSSADQRQAQGTTSMQYVVMF